MKTDTGQVEVESTMRGNEVLMTIDMSDPENAAHIVSILTEQYSDPILAVLREYTANAWDSHQAAGVTAPVTVKIPTTLDPNFVVEDWGVGLTKDDLETIYAMYGASTKRNTNSQVGAFGIGCKSALAYADQFSVQARKDGVECHAMIARTPSGGATMRVISEKPTSKGNGVKVTVPVKHTDAGEFETRADKLYRYWDPASVRLDGRIVESVWEREDIVAITDDIVLVPRDSYDQQHSAYTYYNAPKSNTLSGIIVMGNIGYPIEDGRLESDFVNTGEYEVVAKVPIGAVVLAPSREALQYVPKTTDLLESLSTTIDKEVMKSVQDKIAAATTRSEALKAYHEARSAISSQAAQSWIGNFTWKGENIPDTIPYPNDGLEVVVDRDGDLGRGYYSNSWGQQSYRMSALDQIAQTIVVTRYENTTFGKDQRAKVLAYMKATRADSLAMKAMKLATDSDGITSYSNKRVRIITTPQAWSNEWVPTEQVVKWEPVKEWAKKNLAKAKKTNTAPAWSNVGEVRVTTWTKGSDNDYVFMSSRSPYKKNPKASDYPDALVVCFSSAIDTNEWQGRTDRRKRMNALNELLMYTNKASVVAFHMPANRVDKFRRETSVPDAYEEVKRLAKRKWSRASDASRRGALVTADWAESAVITNLASGLRDRVIDDELRDYLAGFAAQNDAMKAAALHVDDKKLVPFTYDLKLNYPLLAHVDDPGYGESETDVKRLAQELAQDALTYVNAKHKEDAS